MPSIRARPGIYSALASEEIGSITQIVPHANTPPTPPRTTASEPLVYIASLSRTLQPGNDSTGLLSVQPFVVRGRKRDVGQAPWRPVAQEGVFECSRTSFASFLDSRSELSTR